ncbi:MULTISPECIES: hypothetical protein [Giesbergeria]|uniref:Uncharacterized protein n=1 Tax=Giesbergeria sinuosa TaxID=80883 RepID=A0ABV9QCN4_9BURK
MYEIWLVINIVYELALSIWPVVALALAVWLVLLVWARQHIGWQQGPRAVGVGAVVALLLFLTVPTLTQSSLSNLDYWVDWANLLAVALGLGTVAAVFSWPLLALLRPHHRR